MKFLGSILIFLGAGVGLYTGFWTCFIGGAADIVMQVRADTFNIYCFAWGLVKFIAAVPVGLFVFYLFAIPGMALLQDKPVSRSYEN